MEAVTALALLGGLVALAMSFGLGANDVGNTLGTAVGSGSITIMEACGISAIFELLGAILLGNAVSTTLREDIVDPEEYSSDYNELALGFMCAMFGASVWMIIATLRGWPVSTTHSLVGGIVGFGLASKPEAIFWGQLGTIALSWIISPLMGCFIGFCLFFVLKKTINDTKNPLQSAFRSLPFWWAFSVFSLVIFIMLKGLKNLGLHPKTWVTLTISFSIALVVGLVVFFFFIPIFKKQLANLSDNLTRAERKKLNKDNAKKEQEKQKRREMLKQGVVGWMPGNIMHKLRDVAVQTIESHFFSGDASSEHEESLNIEPRNAFLPEQEQKLEDVDESATDAPAALPVPAGATKADEFDSPVVYSPRAHKDGQLTPVDSATDSAKHSNEVVEMEIDETETEHERSLMKAELLFVPLLVLSAVCLSFAHGANDVSKVVAPWAAILEIEDRGYMGVGDESRDTPIWVTLIGGVGLVLGLAILGQKVMRTIGTNITKITYTRGFASQMAATITTLIATVLAFPVSTTHIMIGSVTGVGLVSSWRSINLKLLQKIMLSWIITLPAGASLSILLYLALEPVFID